MFQSYIEKERKYNISLTFSYQNYRFFLQQNFSLDFLSKLALIISKLQIKYGASGYRQPYFLIPFF